MSTEAWRRERAVAEPSAALVAVQAGTDWVFFWCGGGNARGPRATPAEADRALAAARDAVSPAEMERLVGKAERNGRVSLGRQTLTATGTRDALLAERARHEQRWLADILTRHDQLAVVPWQAVAPTGTDALLSLLGAADTVRA